MLDHSQRENLQINTITVTRRISLTAVKRNESVCHYGDSTEYSCVLMTKAAVNIVKFDSKNAS